MDDHCDCCDVRMRHRRVCADYTYVCRDDQCLKWGIRELGRTFTALQTGDADPVPVEEIPGCVWKHAATPFADNY